MTAWCELGRSGLKVSPLFLGCNVFGWTADEATTFALLDAWVDAGFNFIDTDDVYSSWVPGHSGGESETLIGKWLQRSGRRDRIVLATKVGKPMGEGKVGLAPKYIREAVEASLKRLQTDYIDLYQSHDDDANTPLEESLGAFDDLIKQGKVRAIGASNYSAPRLAEALDVSERLGIARYESLQPLYNLYDRAVFEDALEPLCVKREVGVINFYALAAGFLTGKYRKPADAAQNASRGGKVKHYLNERGFGILAALDKVAAAHKATPAQVALAWLMAQPTIAAPIASATSLQQLEDIMGAARLTLSPADLAVLDKASA